jgi:hypothetical protein
MFRMGLGKIKLRRIGRLNMRLSGNLQRESNFLRYLVTL